MADQWGNEAGITSYLYGEEIGSPPHIVYKKFNSIKRT